MSAEPSAFATDRVARLLTAAARLHELGPRFDGLTSADPQTGEQWDRGQVLSHVAEMLPYWVGQVMHVVSSGGDNVPFGRTKATPSRLQRIESGRHDEPTALLARIDAGVADAVALLDRLSDDELRMTGVHSTLGEMTVAELIDEFLVDHVEQHVAQISG
ncbi:MAG: DinB family protein [Frankiaceae bacterium]